MEREPRVPGDPSEVLLSACREIVEHIDVMPARQQQLGEMAADEAGASGDQAMRHETFETFGPR